MQTPYLFTGENHYELRQELTRRKENFIQKFGAESVFSYNGENRDSWAIKQNLYGGGLFITKKLVILFGLPLDTEQTNKLKADQFEKLSEEIMATVIADDTILICVSYKPDKRGRFYKRISKEGQVKEFWLHNAAGLKTFIKQQAEGLKLDDNAITTLLTRVGSNQFRLVSEIEKLCYRQTAHPNELLSAYVVEDVVFSRVEANSFKFFDYLFSHPQQACSLLDTIQNDGTDWNQTSGMLFRGLRNYLLTLDLYEHGVRESKVLMSEGKLAPFVASSLLKQIDILQEHSAFIKHFFKKLVELDYEIKQGIVPAEYFRLRVKELILS